MVTVTETYHIILGRQQIYKKARKELPQSSKYARRSYNNIIAELNIILLDLRKSKTYALIQLDKRIKYFNKLSSRSHKRVIKELNDIKRILNLGYFKKI